MSGWSTIASPDVAFADDEVEHARRRAGFDAGSAPSACAMAGVGVAGFSTTVLPKASAGAALPRRNRDREIPRRDQAEHADRLAIGLRRRSPGRVESSGLAVAAQRLAGEIFEDARRAHDFARAFGERLAFLARQQACRAPSRGS